MPDSAMHRTFLMRYNAVIQFDNGRYFLDSLQLTEHLHLDCGVGAEWV